MGITDQTVNIMVASEGFTHTGTRLRNVVYALPIQFSVLTVTLITRLNCHFVTVLLMM